MELELLKLLPGGGTVVATGTPEVVAEVAASHTGRYLKKVLTGGGLLGGK